MLPLPSPRVICMHRTGCRRPFTGTFLKVTVEKPSAIGNLHAYRVRVDFLMLRSHRPPDHPVPPRIEIRDGTGTNGTLSGQDRCNPC